MKKRTFLVSLLLLVLTLSPSVRAADAPATSVPSRYADLESFLGGVWIATLPPQNDGPPMRLELRFTWNENKQGLHFDSTWLVGDKRAPYTSGMYAWNAAKKRFVIFYTDSSGSLTEGVVTKEGNVFAHEMTLTNKDGSVENIRTRITKLGNNVFTNEIFTEKNGAWTKFIEVKYERKS